MPEIDLKIGNKTTTFIQEEFYVKHTIAAFQYALKQEKYFEKEERDVDDVKQNHMDFAEFMSEAFDKQFTAEQYVNGFRVKDQAIADAIYVECLGGTDDNEKKEVGNTQGEKASPSETPMPNS